MNFFYVSIYLYICVCVCVSEGCSPRNGISRPKDMHISIFAKLYRGSLLKFCFNLSIKKKLTASYAAKDVILNFISLIYQLPCGSFHMPTDHLDFFELLS